MLFGLRADGTHAGGVDEEANQALPINEYCEVSVVLSFVFVCFVFFLFFVAFCVIRATHDTCTRRRNMCML